MLSKHSVSSKRDVQSGQCAAFTRMARETEEGIRRPYNDLDLARRTAAGPTACGLGGRDPVKKG